MSPSWRCPACGAVATLGEESTLVCSACSCRVRLINPATLAEEASSGEQVTGVYVDPSSHETLPVASVRRAISSGNLAPPGYELVEEIGRGGMGVVYRARQTRLNRTCALKMILAGGHAGAAQRERFETEAQAIARLQHENIVRVYEIGEHQGQPFMALEFCEGGSLDRRLRAQQPTPHEAAILVRTLAMGMQAAHDARVIHRDLKPSNILLTGEGTLKVTDFGVARKLDEIGQTHTGSVIGTPSYMPPEQARGEKELGPAVDIYALGAILYECLTGRPPFKAATAMETVLQVIGTEPVAVRQLNPAVPLDLETICLKCLQKDPRKRYASAKELADDLGRFVEGKPILARPVGVVERALRWCRRNPGWAAAWATVALLTLTLIGGLTYGIVTVTALNAAVIKESKEKDEQKLAAQKAAQEAKEQTTRAQENLALYERRLDDSIDSLKLFTDDVRTFCEDALVPGESKSKLIEAMVQRMEKQAANLDQELKEKFDVDRVRSALYVYQSIVLGYIELGSASKAEPVLNKALKLADRWIAERPQDPAGLAYRAAVVHLFGVVQERKLNIVLATTYHTEAYEIRKKLLGNEKVERFTPAKTVMDVADSLDALKRYDEALVVRKEAYEKIQAYNANHDPRPDLVYFSLDAWSWTYSKAAAACKEDDVVRKKAYLEKSNEKYAELEKLRPDGRMVIDRWSKDLHALGELETRAGEQALRDKQEIKAREHFAAASKYFTAQARLTRKLTTAKDLFKQRDAYADSLFDQGTTAKQLGQREQARKHFDQCRLVREELMRDYPQEASSQKLDWAFTLTELGQHTEAIAQADIYSVKYDGKDITYRLARLYSRCIPIVEDARRPAPLTPEDRKLQDSLRDRSLDCLDRSIRNGFDYWNDLKLEPDLNWIRDDPRYQKILARARAP
jgi:hypothetical protein